ncbi:hypothetical protein NIES37_12660 [Tolypothrix tenuis PCC 7101]|uniref:Uncharacterized protein n=1 Tax=Tolypothrix tenuis PCC 7101 TaxID=231146 RepID=A0A1Z4MV28_9CYAN|nr:hypothetical protein [Aulosira sp. FACHB-113]BAY97328.1 hypothetical protein NIES37_12660 [Tolypothrix tenuis PCC 7101]BAZ72163.1 hypothetical protein NIES50_07160 [Aulosira laxa NIES-50]
MTGIPYPRTLEGLFSLLEKPLQTWYPLSIPKEFDSEYGFIYDKALSEEASQYFYEQLIKRGQLPEFASVKIQQIALENFLFQRLLERLQEANETDAERAVQEYVLLRRFLIENPYTTLETLRKTFSKTRYISINDVGELYEDCKENESYWCCDRNPFSVRISDLESDAEFLDVREKLLARRYGWHETQKGHWVSRFRKINFHKIQEDGTVSDRNTEPLDLDGFVHIAGQVASGKSTLSTLLAVDVLRNHSDRRITLVVSDVQSAIRLANQINWWFCDDPENDEPVAVPLLGRTLKSFYASKDFQEHWQRGQPHWGDRFLGTACALQGLLQASDIFDRLHGKPLIPGTEPCHSLKEAPESESKRKKQNNYPSVSHLCPFFAACPSQQVYRDMPNARVWITTPGAMAMAGLPRHLELRPIKIGELVYLHSDIVVFDEVDTVIKWFDDVYAEEVLLTNGGVFDDIGVQTEDYMRFNRVTPPLMQRWTTAERHVQSVVTATLTLLDKHLGHEFLRKWIERGYFTPNSLLYKFSRRLAGLEELDHPDVTEQEIKANNRRVQQIMRYFDALLDDDPLLGQPRPNSKVQRLALLIQQINSIGESATDDNIYRACKAWIVDFFPKTGGRIRSGRYPRNPSLSFTVCLDHHPFRSAHAHCFL